MKALLLVWFACQERSLVATRYSLPTCQCEVPQCRHATATDCQLLPPGHPTCAMITVHFRVCMAGCWWRRWRRCTWRG